MKGLVLASLLGVTIISSNVYSIPCVKHNYDLEGKNPNKCPHCLAEEQKDESKRLNRDLQDLEKKNKQNQDKTGDLKKKN